MITSCFTGVSGSTGGCVEFEVDAVTERNCKHDNICTMMQHIEIKLIILCLYICYLQTPTVMVEQIIRKLSNTSGNEYKN